MKEIDSEFYAILAIFIFLLSLKKEVYLKRMLIKPFIIQWIWVLSILIAINVVWNYQALMILNVPVVVFLCLLQTVFYTMNNRRSDSIRLELIKRYNNDSCFTEDEINYLIAKVKDQNTINIIDFLDRKSTIKEIVKNIVNSI